MWHALYFFLSVSSCLEPYMSVARPGFVHLWSGSSDYAVSTPHMNVTCIHPHSLSLQKSIIWAWHGNLVAKSPCLTWTGIPFRHWFLSWWPHFPSSSLLVAWENSGRWLKALEILPVWEIRKKFLASELGSAQLWLLQPLGYFLCLQHKPAACTAVLFTLTKN